jgi:hypothetical protein
MSAGRALQVAGRNPPGNRPSPIRRLAEPDRVYSRAEYESTVGAIRTRAAGRVSALINDLRELESALGGALPARPAQTLRPRVSLYRSLLSQATVVPPVSADMSAEEILAGFGQYGLRERSFDDVVPVTAPQQIDQFGEWYDAGAVYDAWILNPSIDTKIDFNKPPSQNTPFISANSRMMFQVRKQKVYYLAEGVPVAPGTMQIWLLKFATP